MRSVKTFLALASRGLVVAAAVASRAYVQNLNRGFALGLLPWSGLLAAAVVLTASLTAQAAKVALNIPDDDSSDSRVNVLVATKRSSIGSRSLPHLAELAMAHSPAIAKGKNAMEISLLKLKNARATFLPTLDIEAIHGLADAHPGSRTPPSPFASNLNLVLSENLYDNGANLTNLKVAQAQYDSDKLNYEYLRDQQLLAMAQAYLDWSAALAAREIAENKRDLLRRQADILDAQYRQGLKTKRDVLRIQTEIRRLEMDILTKDNDVDLNFQKLAGTIGVTREQLVVEDIEGEQAKPYAGVDRHLPELKVKDHRRAKILEFAHQQAELKAEQANRDLWPQVLLNGGLGYHVHDYLGTGNTFNNENNYEWSALVTLRYNILDFGTRRRNIELAKVTAQNVKDTNSQTLLDLSNELRDVWNKLREFRADVRMTRELLVLEQRSYSILEAEYRNGRAQYLDLITNLNSLIEARLSFVTSYFGLKKQQMIYAFHKGDLYETLK